MLVFKLHSRCNLNCNYCYMYHHGDQSYLQLPKRVPWTVVENVTRMIKSHCAEESLDSFSISLHGGEPLLVGKEPMDQLLGYMRRELSGIRLKFSLQTNALLIDDDWLRLFNRNLITVGASLDGHEAANVNRVNHSGEGSWAQTVRGIKRLRDGCEQFAGVLAVANPSVRGGDVVSFLIDELAIKWFDILMPDYSHDDLPKDFHNQEKKLLEFMIDAFDHWFPHALHGDIQCRFFDNIMVCLIGEQSAVDTIGHDGVSTVSIDTDGALTPHDALRVCRGFPRGTGLTAGPGAIKALLNSPAYRMALQESRELPDTCQQCSQLKICGGGHLIHRWSNANAFCNPSVHCHTLFGLLTHIQRKLGSMLLANSQFDMREPQVLNPASA